MGGHGDAGLPQSRVAILVPDAGRGDALLGSDEILFGEVAIIDENIGLELACPRIRRHRPKLFRLVDPAAIIPEHEGGGTVLGHQLLDVLAHVGDVVHYIVPLGRAVLLLPLQPRQVVVVVPIHDRVVVAHRDALLRKGLPEHRQHVFSVGCIGDLPLRVVGIEHAEAVVVLGGHDHVLHPCTLGQVRPLVRLELRRVELRRQLRVLILGDLAHGANPLALAEQRVDAPVDEHAELGFPEPTPRFLARGESIFGLRACCHLKSSYESVSVF